jgi:DNA-binding PadR family transcriptional regulator
MHGYQIITKIRKNFGVYFGPSTVYPLLNTLEKKGLVKSEWNMNTERPRKVYSLTNDGQNMLDFTEESLNLICRKIGTQTNTETMESSVQSEVAILAKKGISAQQNHLTLQIH